MRRSFRLACVGAALSAALTFSALAVNTTPAEQLDALGLFHGTNTGYDLERAPTRAEAAAMLVRLLGAEEEAQSLTYTAPFTDLKGWEAPYVQYLYENGLTTGKTATTFGSSDRCTAQMYAAFLLRTLGQSEQNGDFTYNSAVSAAQELGLYDVCINTEAFAREDVAEASYTALSLSPAGADGTLLDQLVADGAVSASAAASVQALFADYAAYRSDTAGMDALLHFSVQTETENASFYREDSESAPFLAVKAAETATFDRTENAVLTERTATLSAPGVDDKAIASAAYVANGMQYRRTDGKWSQSAVSGTVQQQLAAAYGPVPLAYVETLNGGSGSWQVSCGRCLPSLYDELLWPYTSAVGEIEDAPAPLTVTVTHKTQNGRITAQGLSVEFTHANGVGGTIELTSTLNRTGEAALLTPPV